MFSTIDITDIAESRTIEPAILYFGTPVVLIGSTNEDGSPNLAPMSSAWWVGWRCMLGLASNSKTTENMIRSGECVLNLPAADLVDAVNSLARTTGSNPVPAGKIKRGYRHERDKFEISGLTRLAGETVAAPRAAECPVQIEAKLAHVHKMAEEDDVWRGNLVAIEVRVTRVHAHPGIMMDGEPNRIDPDKWRPLIMSFQQFYGLTPTRLQHSELGQIPESAILGAGPDPYSPAVVMDSALARFTRALRPNNWRVPGMTVIIVDEPTNLS